MQRQIRHTVHRRRGFAARVPKVMALVAVVMVAVLLLRRSRDEAAPGVALLDVPPAELVGYWSTEDPRYADRFLRIDSAGVQLGLGFVGGAVYGRITQVSRWTEDGFDVVRVEFDTSAGDDVLEMTLHGSDRMRLRNPAEVVWNRS